MNIQHESLFDTAKVEKLYTEKDGVEVKYVCTTDLKTSDRPMDIFYRATPHPEFGNRYFGLYVNDIDSGLGEVSTSDFGRIKFKL